jgi:hypothetical protein
LRISTSEIFSTKLQTIYKKNVSRPVQMKITENKREIGILYVVYGNCQGGMKP